MRKSLFVLGVLSLLTIGCTYEEFEPYKPIDLGEISTTTNIKSVNQVGNVITVVFETTIGSKYSVQIIPFGEETPIQKEGFIATETITEKVYDLNEESKRDYDLTFMDISGKEVKFPIVIK
jgi:hypothetical protein